MFEQTEINYIREVAEASDASKYAKSTLKRLYAIYDAHTGTKTKDCFCSLTVRKIYFKRIMEWYEANS